MRRLNLKLIFALSLLLLAAVSTHASTTRICTACTQAERISKARDWAQVNIPDSQLRSPRIVNLVDLESNTVITYQVEKVLFPELPPKTGTKIVVAVSRASTPPDVKNKAYDLFNQKSQLVSTVQGVEIPDTVMSDAWEYVNCAYCVQNIEDFVRTQSAVEQVVFSMEAALNSLGIYGAQMPNQYTLDLESGGYIEVKLSIQQDSKLDVQVAKVVDAANNAVPANGSGLGSLNLWIQSQQHSNNVNFFINPLGYSAGSNTGRVTIEVCTPPEMECGQQRVLTKPRPTGRGLILGFGWLRVFRSVSRRWTL